MSALRFPAGKILRSAIPGLGLFKGMWLTFRTFLRRPVTVMYPLEKEVPPEEAEERGNQPGFGTQLLEMRIPGEGHEHVAE